MRLAVPFLAVALAPAALAVPLTVRHQGRLLDATGAAVAGTESLTVRLYDLGTGGSALSTQVIPGVAITDGYFSVDLTLDTEDLDGSSRYLGFTVGDGDELLPRTALVSVPYALRAAVADNAANMSLFDGITRTCANGATQTFDGAAGAWSACPSTWNCADNPTHAGCPGAPASSDFASCKAVRDAPGFNGTQDGLYWIDPDGAGAGDAPFQAWCLMSAAGGGWTMILNVDTGDGHYVDWNNTSFWTSTDGYGTVNTAMTADYKGAVAWRDLAGGEILAMVHTEDVQVAWRAWNLTTSRTMQQISALPTNAVITAGSTASANPAGLDTYEPIVRPGGELEVNARYGAGTSYDESRVLNTQAAGQFSSNDGDNTVMGLGTWMDVNNGTKGSRWDAGLGWDNLGYTKALIGGDEVPGDPWPTTNSRGVHYDYALFLREARRRRRGGRRPDVAVFAGAAAAVAPLTRTSARRSSGSGRAPAP